MRATDDRYRREQARFNLAMRLIKHEARTGTIRYLTGLQDDRIRKLYTTYFKYDAQPVRRRRGRSPTRVGPLVRTPQRALESGAFANLLLANGLFCIERPPGPNLKANMDLGHRLCECFETFEQLIPASFAVVRMGLEPVAEHPARRRARHRALREVPRLLRVRSAVAAPHRLPGVPARSSARPRYRSSSLSAQA